jgi:hypothetical protein
LAALHRCRGGEGAHLIFERWEGADVVNAPLFVERRHRLSSNDFSAGRSHCCLAYTAATLVFSLILLKPGSWRDIKRMKRENLPSRN